MKPEQQRIAIAEACGWKIADRVQPQAKLCACMCWIRPGGNEWQEERLPDYLNDLNAMHEAEKDMVTAEQQNTYYANIAEITWGCEETGDRQVVFNQLTATASQRAEAFLRTIEKWEEDTP